MMLPLAFFFNQNITYILKDQLTQKHLWVLAFLETATKKGDWYRPCELRIPTARLHRKNFESAGYFVHVHVPPWVKIRVQATETKHQGINIIRSCCQFPRLFYRLKEDKERKRGRETERERARKVALIFVFSAKLRELTESCVSI